MYGWEKAPEVPELLDTIAKTAENFTPEVPGFIGEAIASRKHNEKTEYTRAFGNLLKQRGFKLTAPIRGAMSIFITVAINSLDIDVTSESVHKALEHSRKK